MLLTYLLTTCSPANVRTQFISIHVRRGDFKGWCNDVPVNECQAPLSAYVRRVQEVQDELVEKKGLNSLPVLLTSDESDPKWWAEVKALGWHTIDHGPDGEDTTAKLGAWYVVLDHRAFMSRKLTAIDL